MKFKVGDKVRIIHTEYNPDLLGAVGVITELACARRSHRPGHAWVGYGTNIRAANGKFICPNEKSIELVVPVIRGLARLSQREKELT